MTANVIAAVSTVFLLALIVRLLLHDYRNSVHRRDRLGLIWPIGAAISVAGCAALFITGVTS